jgi:hypothetical protein
MQTAASRHPPRPHLRAALSSCVRCAAACRSPAATGSTRGPTSCSTCDLPVIETGGNRQPRRHIGVQAPRRVARATGSAPPMKRRRFEARQAAERRGCGRASARLLDTLARIAAAGSASAFASPSATASRHPWLRRTTGRGIPTTRTFSSCVAAGRRLGSASMQLPSSRTSSAGSPCGSCGACLPTPTDVQICSTLSPAQGGLPVIMCRKVQPKPQISTFMVCRWRGPNCSGALRGRVGERASARPQGMVVCKVCAFTLQVVLNDVILTLYQDHGDRRPCTQAHPAKPQPLTCS